MMERRNGLVLPVLMGLFSLAVIHVCGENWNVGRYSFGNYHNQVKPMESIKASFLIRSGISSSPSPSPSPSYAPTPTVIIVNLFLTINLGLYCNDDMCFHLYPVYEFDSKVFFFSFGGGWGVGGGGGDKKESGF